MAENKPETKYTKVYVVRIVERVRTVEVPGKPGQDAPAYSFAAEKVQDLIENGKLNSLNQDIWDTVRDEFFYSPTKPLYDWDDVVQLGGPPKK